MYCVGCVWKALLALYMPDKNLCLPSIEEVLICSETTSIEEVHYWKSLFCGINNLLFLFR